MAYQQFINPVALLRVMPLVASTCAFRFSVDQYFFLNSFLAPQHRQKANELVPSFFKVFFSWGVYTILILYSISIGTGVANFYGKPNDAWQWYAAGTALATAHFTFVPKIMWPTKALFEDDHKGQSTNELKKWLHIHIIRSALVDFPAWIIFGIACLKSFQPL
ncbi:hypothetical protein BJ170DRAFT_678510 [Xylariales sp. AK1849]|nr:hypothetical protein BJ170DRAFT_678510 [Xylariales sp. AK1849]